MANAGEDDFWEKLQEWSSNALKVPVTLSVSHPEKTSGFRSHWTYLVHTQPSGWRVRRRYSDFEWLLDILNRRYVGLLLPPLPEKNATMMFRGKDAHMHFLLLRGAALELFLEQLMRISYIRMDESMQKFLSVHEDKEWSEIKKVTVVAPPSAGVSISEKAWRGALQRYTCPSNPSKLFSILRKQLDTLENGWKHAFERCKKFADKSRAIPSAVEGLREAVVELSQVESHLTGGISSLETAQARGGRSAAVVAELSAENKRLLELLASMSDVLSRWKEQLIASALPVELFFMERMRFHCNQVLFLKDVIKHRDKEMVNLNKMEKERRLLEVQPGKQKKFEQAAAKVEQHRYQVECLTKSLFLSELERFGAESFRVLQRTFAEVAMTEIVLCRQLADVWKSCLADINVDVDTAKALASARLKGEAMPSSAAPT